MAYTTNNHIIAYLFTVLLSIIFLGFIFFDFASVAFAQILPPQIPPPTKITTYEPLSPLPGIGQTVPGGTETVIDVTQHQAYFEGMFRLLISIATALAVIMIMIGGMQYMMSGAFSTKEEGKKRIFAAVFGLLLAFLAWVILFTINPNLLRLEFNPNVRGGYICARFNYHGPR